MKKLFLVFISILSLKIGLPVDNKYKNHFPENPAEEQFDGPYVYYKDGHILANYIIDNNGKKILKTETVALDQKNNLTLKVATDIPGKFFQVRLKKELQNEKSEFPQASKLLILSDIEGNFEAFRKLLQGNKVIDENFDWKFGDGQLVLVGDFFDRGHQVTELLWFIYYLEDKAKADGGYIHFILGNHEIMNLSGDLRYLNQKYIDNAGLLNQQYVSLYDENSELGRWLRTKNVVEKIGDIVFAHGGISGYINRMNISVPEINTLSRPYYADSMYVYADPRSDTLFGNLGPFWYRGYYEKTNAHIPSQIDATLSQFHINHIVTGHTIVADTVSVWYDGKLLNTDVHHAAGKSEALLVENNKFYRVNPEGNKVLLLEADKK
jgi:hypothetical protein